MDQTASPRRQGAGFHSLKYNGLSDASIFVTVMPTAHLLALLILTFAGNFTVRPEINERTMNDTIVVGDFQKSTPILPKDLILPMWGSA